MADGRGGSGRECQLGAFGLVGVGCSADQAGDGLGDLRGLFEDHRVARAVDLHEVCVVDGGGHGDRVGRGRHQVGGPRRIMVGMVESVARAAVRSKVLKALRKVAMVTIDVALCIASASASTR